MTDEFEEENRRIQEWKLKNVLKILEEARGNGTSMISLIISPGDQISKISKMLNEEISTASNIKSRVNRLSVLSAIVSTQQRLKLYTKIPENGLALYCGTILDSSNKEKKITFDIEPIEPVNTSLYLCDNKFHTKALRSLLKNEEKTGFIILDGKGLLLGTLSGQRKEVLYKLSVELPKKHGRGGQSALRFARLRIEKRHIFLKKVTELATQYFINEQGRVNINNLILAGSGEFKNEFNKSEFLDLRLRSKVLQTVDIGYGGIAGFDQAINLCSDILKDSKFFKEKKTIQSFFEEIAKNSNKYIFGFRETLNALESGAIQKLLCWEDLKILRIIAYDAKAKKESIFYIQENHFEKNFKEENSAVEIKEKEYFLSWIINNRNCFGATVFLITNKTPEGSQFVKSFGGIGGILRYESKNTNNLQV
ncbi:eukaryotic release factor 1 (nucleomorph) [Cryptomonas paramecium]|uniref:Eukaryotic release factor 1 n=1 Tax=Cryptomonas paramaecium TaxID=2898 RepID=F2HI26_9CRYP|nr:eukaryotic release factor 1 [Cryptomonas paramecium]AEA38972.1 eukaryotic release factor 1 [Cryptomonas paramecium]|mmetsp:Transcript_51907/g.135430  ORF Transcript_51907/g.135430 Transcript_51907/m.135430 type:complete len:423 (+) Transcript_51907:2068-3336(+)